MQIRLKERIDDLGNILIEMTTDYATPMLHHIGASEADLEVARDICRPTIESMGEYFSGLIASDLDKIVAAVATGIRANGGDVRKFVRLTYDLSRGTGSWAHLDFADWVTFGKMWLSSPASVKTLMVPEAKADEISRLFVEHVLQPMEFIESYEKDCERDWLRGRRTAWDNVVYDQIFSGLGFATILPSRIEGKFVRSFAACAMGVLDSDTDALLQAACSKALVAGSFRASGSPVMSLGNIARQSAADVSAIEAELQRAGL